MGRHYLDHASTTPLRPQAAAAIESCLSQLRGDPGRLHEEGREVRALVEDAREKVAALCQVAPRQVIFTSGATEAINAATWGATRMRPGAKVAVAPVEHSAVRESSERLAPLVALGVDPDGTLSPAALRAALLEAGDPPALVHCQWANHEVGTIQPVTQVLEVCREVGVPLHVDAAAALGHLEVDVGSLGADLVSVSAHKLGGPPGVGALVVRSGLRIPPFMVGGSQERARRAGMENVVGIAGFGAAAAALLEPGARPREEAAARRHIAHLVQAATSLEGVAVVGPQDPSRRLPHVVTFVIEGIAAEPVLLALDRLGIAVHSGSACAAEVLEPSPVLQAMGIASEQSLRVSVGWSTTDQDVAAFAASFPQVVAQVRSLRA